MRPQPPCVNIVAMTQSEPLKKDQLDSAASGAENAAKLLCAPGGLMRLSLEEARVVVRYMTPRFIPAGTMFIKEGDAGDGGFMALLIEGDVVVEQITVKRTEPITVRVLGPGSLVGEMGLVDNEPRSASCTASSDVMCAILTPVAIEHMIAEVPMVAAKLLLSVSSHIAERLRNTARQLKLYARLASAMQEEIEQLTRIAETPVTRPPTQAASL
jgi:CRP-like cAMP-binding protein